MRKSAVSISEPASAPHNVNNAINILLVDDEPSVLKALARCIRIDSFRIFFASGVEQAKQLLSERYFDILMTDLRMPQGGGAALLAEATVNYGHVIRILLTGYADLCSVKAFLNSKQIHFYLEKPWHREDLTSVLQKAKRQVLLKRNESIRLNKISCLTDHLKHRQDYISKLYNVSLRKLKESVAEQHESGIKTASCLLNLIDISPNLDEAVSNDAYIFAGFLAEALNLSHTETQLLKLSSQLCEIGLIGVDKNIVERPIHSLNHHQMKLYLNQIHHADRLLAPIDGTEQLREILFHQFCSIEYATLSSSAIPKTALLLALIRDVCLLRNGRMSGAKYTVSSIRDYLKKYAGLKYPQHAVATALTLLDECHSLMSRRVHAIDELLPSMVLSKDIYLDNAMLVFPKGHVLTSGNIKQLRKIAANSEQMLGICAEMPSDN